MKTTLLLFVLLTFQQPVPDPTLTLNIEGQEVSIKESAARAEYAQLEKAGSVNTPRFVALTIALGTASRPQALPRNTATREFLDNEVRRGVRRPAQGDNYFPE